MGIKERNEYFELFCKGEWTVQSIRRLRELRIWKDRDDIPEELRTKSEPTI